VRSGQGLTGCKIFGGPFLPKLESLGCGLVAFSNLGISLGLPKILSNHRSLYRMTARWRDV
jgi:hypothetical protein